MGELIQFVPRTTSKTLLEVHEDKAAEFLAAAPALSLPSERVRRMIEQARAQYQAIFPDAPRAEDTSPCETNPDSLA